MSIGKFTKDPQEVLDYEIDWSKEWLPTGDSIASAVATCADSAITVKSTDVLEGKTVTWLSGGAAGSVYEVTVHVVTAQAREGERSFTVVCKDR